jgi:hypothetical protein
MNNFLLTRTLRRALLLSLTVPLASAGAACGGNVVATNGSGGSTGTTGTTTTGTPITGTTTTGTTTTTTGTSGSTSSGTGGGCALQSTTPTTVINGGCAEFFELIGNASDCGVPGGGTLPPGECAMLCPPSTQMRPAISCSVSDQSQPPNALLYCIYTPCGTGRRPPGLAAASGADTGPSPVARFLGEVAHLEAASVVAFERLAAELVVHGAPARLVRAARRAAREEERHASVTRGFALRAGARPEPVEVAATTPRSLEAIAVDNAVEGCVRETFGAVLAMRQAEQARDEDLRRAMARIAREETRHAALSWELGRWLEGRLGAAGRRRVRRERDRAVAALRHEAAREPHPSLVTELGVPTSAQAKAALDSLDASLWSSPRERHPLPSSS